MKQLVSKILLLSLFLTNVVQASYITKPSTGGGGGGGTWGSITGTLSDQTDLQSALNLKVRGPSSSTAFGVPTFSGTTGKLLLDNPLVTIDSSGNISANAIFSGAYEGLNSTGFAIGTSQPYEQIDLGQMTDDGTFNFITGEFGFLGIGANASVPNQINLGNPASTLNLIGSTFFSGGDVDFGSANLTSVGAAGFSGIVSLFGTGAPLRLRQGTYTEYYDAGNTKLVRIRPPATIANTYNMFLPDDQGGANTFLKNDGSGNLSWGTPSSSVAWGSITGTLSSQTDLNTALGLKSPSASPTFTGTITTPLTASRALVTGASNELAVSTVTATEVGYLSGVTGALQTQITAKAPAASPTFTGTVTLPTSAGVVKSSAGGVVSVGSVSLATEVTGNLPVGNLNSGTGASGSTFWRGDGTWAAASGGGGVWGSITGTLSSQTDLVAALAAKAPTASPTFTGTITTDAAAIAVTSIAGLPLLYFGDGSDGDLSISSGVTTLTRDTFYHNVTITGTGSISTSGYRLFINGTLDITNAPADAITGSGNVGTNATSAAGATAPTAQGANTVGLAGTGGVGGTGSGTTGAVGTVGATQTTANGNAGGGGGAGGLGASGAGGATVGASAVSGFSPINRYATDLLRGIVQIAGGAGGSGGSGGGGDGSAGAGGGSGGNGGRPTYIAANNVSRGGSTAAGAISAKGGNGGNGFTPGGGNRGGAGAGGGGGGGWLYFLFGSLTGSTATNCIDVSGGNGGTGGAKTGTGVDGTGGQGASGGRYTLLNMGAGTSTNGFGTAGSAASGRTGGAGNTVQASL